MNGVLLRLAVLAVVFGLALGLALRRARRVGVEHATGRAVVAVAPFAVALSWIYGAATQEPLALRADLAGHAAALALLAASAIPLFFVTRAVASGKAPPVRANVALLAYGLFWLAAGLLSGAATYAGDAIVRVAPRLPQAEIVALAFTAGLAILVLAMARLLLTIARVPPAAR